MKESVKDQELETIVGGTAEEIDAIIQKFRYYGYDQQADRLVKSGSIRFGDTLSKILEEMGFPYKLTLYADYEQQKRSVREYLCSSCSDGDGFSFGGKSADSAAL